MYISLSLSIYIYIYTHMYICTLLWKSVFLESSS